MLTAKQITGQFSRFMTIMKQQSWDCFKNFDFAADVIDGLDEMENNAKSSDEDDAALDYRSSDICIFSKCNHNVLCPPPDIVLIETKINHPPPSQQNEKHDFTFAGVHRGLQLQNELKK